MSREEAIEVEGRVIEILPNSVFRVELPNGHRILVHTPGKVRMKFIRIGLGDMVMVEMSPYDLSRGCIAFKED